MFNFNNGRKASSNPTVVIMTKFLSQDFYFERPDHQPNHKFNGKRYKDEEAALASIGNNILNGDAVEFIDSKERCIKRYVKGSNKVTILKNGEEAVVTTNF
jgi:hypothetical protein